jgi:hypothetical protein
MRPSQIVPDDAQQAFWSVVEECILVFHQKQSHSAMAKLKELRQKIESAPLEQLEMFFHSEPFEVACTLAGRPLKVEDHLSKYLSIRDANDPGAP